MADTDRLLIEMVRGEDYIADPAGEAARLDGLLAVLERLAVRELAGLPGAGEVLADVRARIGDQQAVLRLAESDWSVPFEVWSAAWVEGMLAELTATYPGTPTRLRGAVLQTLLDYFEMDLGEGELRFLADPGWLGGVFATAEPGVWKWLFGNWSDVHQRDQLLRGLAAAATGAPSWFGEMPKRNRSRSWLTTLVRWGADPRLAPHHDAVNALLAGLPARGVDGERGRALSAWLDVVAALVRVAPILTGEQRHAGIEEILVRLRGVLARPGEDRVGVLSEAATQVQVAGIGFYLDDIGVHRAAGRPLPMPVEAREWDVLLGHHHVADPAFTAAVAHYVREGGGVEGSEAFWRHWHARLEHLDGRSPVVARERAPPPFVTVVHPAGDPDGAGLPVRLTVERDPVQILLLGHPRLGGSCLDCLTGTKRRAAQAYVMNPGISVVYARRSDAPATGPRLARVAAASTDEGLLPLSEKVYTSSKWDFRAAFGEQLLRMAARTGEDLLLTAQQVAAFGIVLPAGAAPEMVTVTLPHTADGPDTIHAEAFGGDHSLSTPIILEVYRLRPGRPGLAVDAPGGTDGPATQASTPRTGGAVAVLRRDGSPTRLDDDEHGLVLRVLERLHAVMREAPGALRLVDPAGAWAGYGPRLFAVPGLIDGLPSRFAVVMFVAPDSSIRTGWRCSSTPRCWRGCCCSTSAQRGLLAEREQARLHGVGEDEVQAMPLPPAQALLTLVLPELGRGLTTGPLPDPERRSLALMLAAGLGGQPAGRAGGPVTLDWGAVGPQLERRGLGRLREELVSFTVVDVHGRRWTAAFRHTRAEIDQLVREGFLPHDFPRMLENHDGAHGDAALALVLVRLLNARIRRDELTRARGLDRHDVLALRGLRALLAQVAGNPGVGLDELRLTVLTTGSAEQASAVVDLLAGSGLLRVGAGGDTYGPVQRATALLHRVTERADVADETLRALLGETAALLASRPALWDERITRRAAQLLALLVELPELGLRSGAPDTRLDVLHMLAATPDGVVRAGWDGADQAELMTLRDAGMVVVAGHGRSHWRVRPEVRRLLGDLANPDEVDEPGYRRELAALAELLSREAAGGGAAGAPADGLAELVARLRTTDGSPLHPDADRGALWEPGPGSDGAVLLAVRDRPGVNTVDLATALGVSEDYASSSARRLARIGLVQVTHRAGGGEYYLLRPPVLELVAALENPDRTTGAYRAALLDLADLLMRDVSHRPSLARLAETVQALRGMDDSPLEATARVDELYEPPLVSYLDLLTAIAASPGSGVFELARALGVSTEFLRGELVQRMVPELVGSTRRVLYFPWRDLVIAPSDSLDTPEVETAHPSRTKFTYELTELGMLLLAALRDPEAVLADPRDRAVLHRAGLLLRLNPGRDRIRWAALLDAVARLLAPSAPVEVRPVTRRTTPRGILDAVAAADGWVTALELVGTDDPVVTRKLGRLAMWGLLELAHAADGRALYRAPEHTVALLHDLDYRATIVDGRYRNALDALAGWFDQPSSLDLRKLATRRIDALLARIRDMPGSPLPEVVHRQVSVRRLLDAIGEAGQAGITLADLLEVLSLDHHVTTVKRLTTLHAWGLVDRRVDMTADRGGRRYLYVLPEHTVALLHHLDDRILQPDPGYLVLLDELAGWFDKSINLGRSARTGRVKTVVDAIREVPGSPLPRLPVRGAPSSVRRMLDVLADGGPMAVADIVAALPTVGATVVGRRLTTLFAEGLVERRAVLHWTARGVNARFVYVLPEHTRVLLADLDERADRAEDYAAALEELAGWLDSTLPLQQGTEQAREFARVVARVRDIEDGPLPARTRAPISSYRGTVDAIAEAGEAGITAEELAVLAEIGVVPMRVRLRALLGWQLVERTPGTGERAGRKVYRVSEPVSRLLAALDDPSGFTREESRRRLQVLAELLAAPVAKLGPSARDKVTDALDAIREMHYSPVRSLRGRPSGESVWATLLVLAGPNGATAQQVGDETGIGGRAASGRLHALWQAGWLVRLSGTQGLAIRYGLADRTRQLLEDLDDVDGIADEEYRAAARVLTRVLARSAALRAGEPGTREVLDALEAVGPFLPGPGLQVAEDSLWATLDAIVALGTGPVGAKEVVDATGMLTLHAMSHRLHVLGEWGLLHVTIGPRGRRLYVVPGPVRRLLADLADPDRILEQAHRDGVDEAQLRRLEAYQAAVRRLAPLLAENANLLDGSPRTAPLAQAVAVLFELDAGPLAAVAPQVPADSLWGTLLALAAADRPVSIEWLAGEQALSRTGLTSRLTLLDQLGLVGREVRWAGGERPGERAEVVYRLGENAPDVLADLADPAAIEDDARRAATEQLAALVGTSTNMAKSAARQSVLAGIDAVLAVPGGPLAPVVLHVEPGSPRATLETAAAAGKRGVTIGELAGNDTTRRQVNALHAMGLLERHPNPDAPGAGAGPELWRYTVTDRTQELLAELDLLADPAQIADRDRLTTLWTLAGVVNKVDALKSTSPARRRLTTILTRLDQQSQPGRADGA